MVIGFSYINNSNLGDEIIYRTAEYLLKRCLEENDLADTEILPVCLSLADAKVKESEKHPTLVKKIKLYMKRKVKEFLFADLDRRIARTSCEKKKQELLRKKWEMTYTCTYFRKNELPKIGKTDVVFLFGGGIIKYHQQYFHYMIDEITRECEQRNIPVLICSAGVEGYDAGDPACRLLKNALSRSCVKYVSTRDDYDTLLQFMDQNEAAETELVCDPAFWIREAFGMEAGRKTEPADDRKPTIGLNAIRPDIFSEYMYEVDEDALLETYYELTMKLLSDGKNVEFFTNGVASDATMFSRLFQSYPALNEYKRSGRLTLFLPENAQQLMERIASYERFMAVRLHASIVGSVLGVPNISLVWCIKQLLFGQQTGTRENFITKEHFEADYLYEKLCNVKAYEMNPAYKNTVYASAEKLIRTYCMKTGA